MSAGSMRRWRSLAGGLAIAAALGGCALFAGEGEPPPAPGPGAPEEPAALDWAKSEDTFVLVDRSCRTVSIYRRGKWLRTYENVSFGRVPGVKEYRGDKRTPAGLYKIVGRRVHPRWSRFLLLDYPNLNDREKHADPGGEIGIHGSDEPILNRTGVDWTLGCISLLNDDVREFYQLVPDGTLVLIEE
jgi:murein L,D-transpeptidase YafK